MNAKIKRRDILRHVGAAAGGASLIAGASDTAAAHPDRERDRGTELTGADRARAIGKALRNNQFRALLWNFYVRQGFRPTGTVNVIKVDEARVVSLPFAVKHEHDSRHVTWVGQRDADETVEGMTAVHHHPDDREKYWRVTTYRIDDGEIVQETADIPNFLGCDNPDIACIFQIAGANIVNSVTCASCASSMGWLIPACALCVAATLTGVGIVINCAEDGSWCEDRG